MKINNLFFIVVLTVLCLSLGAVSATDIDDVTSVDANDVISVQDVDDEIIEDSVDSAKLANMDDSDDMNIKSSQSESLSTSGVYNVNNANWDDIFTTDKKLNIADYSTINFTSDVYRNNSKIYTIDKAVTINGNGFTLNLDTISGSYFGNETGSAFTINTNGSGTTVNDLKFYNTQVFVRNASNVVLDNINVTVENQRIGSGVGVTSIRDYSHNVTVRNSYFRTKDNDGSSTLVLAGADNCVLDNNVIIGEGNVGNLLYLTTYNINGVPEDDTNVNSYNNITNNQITGPSASALCYGITLTGHNNLVENNTIDYSGQAITTQWGYTDPNNMSVGNNSEAYTGNNFINNIVLNGGSVKTSKLSTVRDNTFTGTVSTGIGSVYTNNTIGGKTTVQANTTLTYNTINNTVSISGSNVLIEHNIIYGDVVSKITYKNTTVINNIVMGSIFLVTKNENNTKILPNSNRGFLNSPIASYKSTEEDVVYITEENLNDYFTNFDGYFDFYLFYPQNPKEGTVFVLTSGAANKIDMPICLDLAGYGVVLMGDGNTIIKQPIFCIDQQGNKLTIKNIEFSYLFLSSNFEPPIWFSEDSDSQVTFDNVTVKITVNKLPNEVLERALIDVNSRANITFMNCNFIISVPGNTINWDSETSQRVVPMRFSSPVTFINNTVNITQTTHDAEGSYPTNFVMMLGNDNTIVGNNIIVTSKSDLGYLYAITMSGKSNNNISDNNFTIVGSKYTSGIYMTGVNYGNNTIANNIINCSSGFAGNTGNEGGIDAGNNKAEDSIYPIVIEDSKYHGGTYSESTITVTGNKILNNTIYASGNNGYGIEQFGGNDTTIANNTIIVTGVTPKAIAFTGTNSLISGNTIIVSGSTNESGTTADYFPAKTNGIYLQASSGVVVSENNIDVVNGSGIATNSYSGLSITDNNISTDQEYAILLKSTTDTTVSDNALKSKNGVGNDAVYSNDESNIIGDNTAPAGSPSVIVAEDINACYGDEIVVAILKDAKGEVLASKTVTVTIGDETYTVTTNDNGEVVLSIANVPGTYNAVVKFDGDETYDGSEASINAIVNAIPVNLGVSNLVKYYGDSKKLSIVLKDIDGNGLASKKVTVTIKGKTYTLTTDKNGKATLAINLAKGSYSALVKFDETGYQTVSKNVSVKVVTPIIKAVKTKVKKGKYFQVSFKTYNKKAIKSTKVTMKLKGKTYTVKTNSKGIAKLKLKVKKGTYKVKAAFKSTAKYGKTAKTLKVKVY